MRSTRLASRQRRGILWRITCTLVAIIALQTVVCGLALLPIALLWRMLLAQLAPHSIGTVALLACLAVPSYALFAVALMVCSAAATRVTGLRTRPDAEMRIADVGWDVLRWVQYMVATHLVRVLAGTLFRGSPLWTIYLRLNGARVGRRVYVNSLFLSDHNLLELADDVVIGAEVHLAGHTVERGHVKTGRVRLGRGVTIGLGTVVDIDVDIGDGCQVGALSLVPKGSRLEPHAVYTGIPVLRR